jgi:uncharacterized protein (TIGR02145 family)
MKKYITLLVAIILWTNVKAQFNCEDTLIDIRDGKKYTTVLVGSQCWMSKNLNIGTYIDPLIGQANNAVIEKYCYDNISSKCDSLGGLYEWNEMMQYTITEGMQGVCPTGWHVPSDAEWSTLINYVGGPPTSDSMLCEGCTTGFNALLSGGLSGISGNFFNEDNFAYFWTSTEESTANAWSYSGFRISAPQNNNQDLNPKEAAFSIRCIEDETVGLNEQFQNHAINLSLPYPNPTSTATSVYYHMPQGTKAGKIVIYDGLGKEVKRIKITSSSGILVIGELPQGSYYFRLITEKGISCTRTLIVTN